MTKYFTKTRNIFLDEEEVLKEDFVQEMISEIQKNEPRAELVTVEQSLVSGGLLAKDRLVITVVMKKEVFKDS